MLTRLATYGTLAPGRANHHQLAGLNGRWFKGIVRGDLVQAGWGASLGFPGLVLNPAGAEVEVDVFESRDLPEHWARLDAFEGEGYYRSLAQVELADVTVDAWIYVLATSSHNQARA
ncbi:gamma-glutamylcyclotransferase [Methylobacterium sp. 1030]|uniref:gamma-glutamylcyclotransferase family protein n=1 Tax=Methylobacterium sp. 1030 TaxID=3156404 RepID=UPI00339B03EC